MLLVICKNKEAVGQKVGALISEYIKKKPNAVLGLATGSSVLETYGLLADKDGAYAADWSGVKTFNLDEYVGLEGTDPQSYRFFMKKYLFDHVNVDPAQTHVPNGKGDLSKEPAEYEQKIKSAGGVDLQLLGIGVNGHIGFNEPGSPFDSRTRVVNLTDSTIEANSRNFADKTQVPKQAISLGLGTITDAQKIILIATGDSKADAIASLFEGVEGPDLPCTALRRHADVTVFADRQAASKLHKTFKATLTGKAVYKF